jgi:hypothetical protein
MVVAAALSFFLIALFTSSLGEGDAEVREREVEASREQLGATGWNRVGAGQIGPDFRKAEG